MEESYFWCFDCRPQGAIGKLIPLAQDVVWHLKDGHEVRVIRQVIDREFELKTIQLEQTHSNI